MVLAFCVSCVAGAVRAERPGARRGLFRKPASSADARCDAYVQPITAGYGCDGIYRVDRRSVGGRTPATVFLPKGAATPRPVIFLAHGYGPNRYEYYLPLIDHIASRGYVVVFGTFPMFCATIDERYTDLWESFDAAVRKFGAKMDLSRVGVVGHSFGGGATPTVMEKALARGWCERGAFMFMLAPWYFYEIDNAQLKHIRRGVIVAFETYEDDTVNDHRMAIDIYDSAEAPTDRYFFGVRSLSVNGCELIADHATPARNP